MKNYDNKLVVKYILESNTIADVLRKLNLDPRGRNYKFIYDIIDNFKLDTSHFLGCGHGKSTKSKCVPWEDVLVENSLFILTTLRKNRLINDKLLKNECYICKLTSWLNKTLILQIDHINGNNSDNRIENLRLLCPNCHSQTETFAGRNNKRKAKDNKNTICFCGQKKAIYSKMCRKCFNKQKLDKSTKIIWPSNNDLLELLKTTNFSALGRELGVSDNAIRKRLKVRGLC